MSESPPKEKTEELMSSPRARLYVRWALINVALTTLATALALLIWMKEGSVRGQLARVKQRAKQGCVDTTRVIEANKPLIVDPAEIAPPQDQPRSGYVGRFGTEILPAMLVRLEAVRGAGKPLAEARFGAQEVLPSGSIHVVNLWATWCGPCKAEMPDFKKMFETKADAWDGKVRFLPVQIKDNTDPRKSYGDFEAIMPPSPVKLADRSYDEAFVKVLERDDQRKLFHGNLPVTLVLDCNRRVRWAKFEQLTEQDFADLEQQIDRLKAELDDPDPEGWCRKAWAGNGRCEGKESTPAHHSPEDCGDLRRRPSPTDLQPGDLPIVDPSAKTCPAGQTMTADGRCIARLKGQPIPTKVEEPKAPKSCGNHVCEPARGESSETCCQDCACKAPLVCKPSDGSYSCQAGLK